MNLDWAAIWAVLGPAVVGLGTWLKMRKPNQAKMDAAVAQARAEGAVADAEGTLYARLREEIDAMRRDILSVRADLAQTRSELDAERAHSRRQDSYIWMLIRLLREHNIQPPPFNEDAPA
jgi:hypothetical protein